MATQVMLSVCPCKNDCVPVRWFLITSVLPKGKAMCVPSGCHFKPLGTFPAVERWTCRERARLAGIKEQRPSRDGNVAGDPRACAL